MPSKEKDTVVETQAAETEACCSCGTHGSHKVILHVVIGVVALFMLCSVFAVGAIIKVVVGHGDIGRGGRAVIQTGQTCDGTGNCDMSGNTNGRMMDRGGNYGPGMMDRGGRGMMRDGQGYYYDESNIPDAEERPAPAIPQGGATQ